MNALTNFTTAKTLTMSSREIAERTDKRHADVLRDARVMLEQIGLAERSFASSYQDSTGRTLPELLLPKDITLTLVAGYSAPLRHRIVLRWIELEEAAKGPALPNFTDPVAGAEAWIESYKRPRSRPTCWRLLQHSFSHAKRGRVVGNQRQG